jgi:hypothetical protein
MNARNLYGNARASVVNRTHRVVRAEALTMAEQRSRSRGLWLPLGICSSLLLVACYAAWAISDAYELAPGTELTSGGGPDASNQLFLLVLWVLPVTALALGAAFLRHSRFGNNEVSQ